jgi:hypothetical protein
VKIKENGLPEGNPEKSGVLVNKADLIPELKRRLERKAKIDSMVSWSPILIPGTTFLLGAAFGVALPLLWRST